MNRISKLLTALGLLNLGIGIINTMNGIRISWVNLVVATLLMYGLGRIHGKKESLQLDRTLQE